jgi:predicted secreted hydrolase
MVNQELVTGRSTAVTYWEGSVAVKGTSNGKSVTGQGYVEMTGYAEKFKQKL